MKNKKKIIAIVVAIAIVASIFVVSTVANTKTTAITISTSKAELSAGETATVTVKVTTNYPVALMSIPVFFDKTLVDVSNENASLTSYSVHEVTLDSKAENANKVFLNTGLSNDKYGFVLVTYIGGANATVSALENTTVLTFTITAKADVSGEAAIKCVSGSAKTESNAEGALYFGTTTSGNQITSIPENVEGINLDAAVSSVAIVGGSTTLVAKDGKNTAFDETNKYIYGITPGESVEDYIAVNNGSYELVANSEGKTSGTGATVKVKNSSGTVVETYTVIIFGDVNGDGVITGVDELKFKQYTSGTTSSVTGIYLSAFDVNGDGLNNGIDEMAISQFTSGTSSAVPANPFAE